jgi:uncharacterized protein (TIGR04222 family)
MRRLILIVALLLAAPASAAAKDYSAQRFDVTIRVLDDGSIQVTETTRMTFEGGPFTFVSREIPVRKTDGIEILGASMDGAVLRRGVEPGRFEVRTGDSRVSVRWHFPPLDGGSHEFRLSYLVRGVVQQTAGGHVLEWQALPGEHRYTIAASRIVLEGAATDRAPMLRSRRVTDARQERTERGWAIDARGIGRDGWIALSSPTTAPAGYSPRWQQRERRQRALAPRMIQFGAIAFTLSLAVVLLLWRQYPPAPHVDEQTATLTPPSARPPAIAAAILAGGKSTNAHAPGTLFDLAARDVLAVSEQERGWRRRPRFMVSRAEGGALAPHESALLDVIFGTGRTVDVSKAAARLARGGRRFRHAVNEELQRLGLTDERRRRSSRALFVAGVVLAGLSLAAAAVAVFSNAGPWGLAVPIAIDLAATLAIVLAVTRAELSDEGFRERARWRAFRRGLKESLGSGAALRYLPYVTALGLGVPLARHLKKQGGEVALPPWFRTLAGSDETAAFAAFISTSAASTGSGASTAGAAGGGSSGAG